MGLNNRLESFFDARKSAIEAKIKMKLIYIYK